MATAAGQTSCRFGVAAWSQPRTGSVRERFECAIYANLKSPISNLQSEIQQPRAIIFPTGHMPRSHVSSSHFLTPHLIASPFSRLPTPPLHHAAGSRLSRLLTFTFSLSPSHFLTFAPSHFHTFSFSRFPTPARSHPPAANALHSPLHHHRRPSQLAPRAKKEAGLRPASENSRTHTTIHFAGVITMLRYSTGP